jgi:hypothetical protein
VYVVAAVIGRLGVEFVVRFYTLDDEGMHCPIVSFLEQLRRTDPILHKLLVVGLKKLEQREFHGETLTRLVDENDDIFEVRIGRTQIARAFFFFRRGREIIVTNGHVKKQMKADPRALTLARKYKRDWETRFP